MLPDYLFKHVVKVEGEFVNHPMDKGGPTKWGITLGTLSSYRQRHTTVDDVGFLSETEAKLIYGSLYYEANKINLIKSKKILLILFDQCVLWGSIAAVKRMQRVLNLAPFHSKIEVDGFLGPRTLEILNTIDEDELSRYYIQKSQLDLVSVAVKDTTQLVFLKGWISRTHILWNSLEGIT